MQTLGSLTQPHLQQVRQYGLSPSVTPDRLKLRGWVASGSFVAGWVGEIDGAAVCFGDNGTANGFSGPNPYVLAPGPFNGTAGWFTAATVHKYVDVGPTKVKAVVKEYPSGPNAGLWRFLIKIGAPNLTYGTASLPAHVPTGWLYFGAGGVNGCALSDPGVVCAQNGAQTVTNCTL